MSGYNCSNLLKLKKNFVLINTINLPKCCVFNKLSKEIKFSTSSDLEYVHQKSNNDHFLCTTCSTRQSLYPSLSCCQAKVVSQVRNKNIALTKQIALNNIPQFSQGFVQYRQFTTTSNMNFNADEKAKYTPPENLGNKVSTI